MKLFVISQSIPAHSFICGGCGARASKFWRTMEFTVKTQHQDVTWGDWVYRCGCGVLGRLYVGKRRAA